VGTLYGTTINAGDPFMRELVDDQAILAQACELRLQTKRGTYWSDPEYGEAVTEYVNEHLTADSLARVPGRVQAELEKDERIASVDVEATLDGPVTARRIRLTIRITPLQGTSFAMVLLVSEVSVEVLTKGSL
jgi:phage baseplate assembly protein W